MRSEHPRVRTGLALTRRHVGVPHSSCEPITYTWAFGDGSVGDGALLTHSYAKSGTYTVTLTATNLCGQQQVEEDINVLPVTVTYQIYLPLILKQAH